MANEHVEAEHDGEVDAHNGCDRDELPCPCALGVVGSGHGEEEDRTFLGEDRNPVRNSWDACVRV